MSENFQDMYSALVRDFRRQLDIQAERLKVRRVIARGDDGIDVALSIIATDYSDGCVTVYVSAVPSFEGRIALCTYKGCKSNKRKSTHYGDYGDDGRSRAPSSPDLPFFVHKPTKEFDEFYCGCFGWD